MSNSDLITQVRKEDQTKTSITVEVQPEGRRRTLLELLCCCLPCHKPTPPNNHHQPKTTPTVNYNAYPPNIPDIPQLPGNLLPQIPRDCVGKKTLVLDLDETLVHSSFKPIPNPDFIIPVEIENQVHKVYVVKRPHVDTFLQKIGPIFEIVVFTASLAKYADPVLDLLDTHKVIRSRLFREACSFYRGNFVKDMNRLGRELSKVAIIDNSPTSYLFQPENSIPCESWFDDMKDAELLDFVPFLENLAASEENIRDYLQSVRNPVTGKIMVEKFK